MSTFGQPYARAIHTLGSSTKASLSAGPCEDFTIPAVVLLSGLSTGVKHGTRLSIGALHWDVVRQAHNPVGSAPAFNVAHYTKA